MLKAMLVQTGIIPDIANMICSYLACPNCHGVNTCDMCNCGRVGCTTCVHNCGHRNTRPRLCETCGVDFASCRTCPPHACNLCLTTLCVYCEEEIVITGEFSTTNAEICEQCNELLWEIQC